MYLFLSLALTLQLKSLMEREALEGSQSSTASPSKAQQEELFLFPAENSALTTLPGVARVVHSKASCTVHWLESGKNRPNAKELPAAQILGIHTTPSQRGGSKAGRGSAAVAGASANVLGDTRRTEPSNFESIPDSSAKVEEKRPQSLSVSSQQTVTHREEGNGLGSSENDKICSGGEANGGLAVTKNTDALCTGAESSSEQCTEEQNSTSPDSAQTTPAKPSVTNSEEGMSQGSVPPAKERTVEQIREEGWNCRDAENVTLAELYLMFGKPGKLQLEYEFQPVAVPSNNQDNAQSSVSFKTNRTNRVLRCLLKLVATEVNPKPLVRTHFYFFHSCFSLTEIHCNLQNFCL